MKCYAIKSGNEYIANVPRPYIDRYWEANKLEITDDADEIKHYKSHKIATNWID